MRYYKLSYSLIQKEIGDFPQSDTMRDGYNYNAPDSIWKVDFTSKIPFAPNLDAIKLTKKAKILDLINSVTVSTSGLIISERFLKLLSQFKCDPDFQVFDIKMVRDNDQWHYYYYYNFSERLEFLDFEEMNLFLTNSVGRKAQPISVNSQEDFLNFEKDPFLNFNPEKLIFKNPKYDLFKLAKLGFGYYASERLKDAIKEAGMTGIDFKPIEELVFLR